MNTESNALSSVFPFITHHSEFSIISYLARKDSNLDAQDQNLVCYRYTTGQTDHKSSGGKARGRRNNPEGKRGFRPPFIAAAPASTAIRPLVYLFGPLAKPLDDPPPLAGVEGIVGGGKGLSSRRQRLHPITEFAQHLRLRLIPQPQQEFLEFSQRQKGKGQTRGGGNVFTVFI